MDVHLRHVWHEITISDHRYLSVRVKLRTRKTPAKGAICDWKAIKYPTLQEQFTLSVKNRNSELCIEADTAREEYQHLIPANDEAAQKLLPTRKKKCKKQLAEDSSVANARQKVQKAFTEYQNVPGKSQQSNLQFEKQNLESRYSDIAEEELKSMIQKVENANSTHEHAEIWKLNKWSEDSKERCTEGKQ